MPKPDKVLRNRPLKELEAAVSKLKRVVLLHPKPIVEELPAQYCVCKKDEHGPKGKSKEMVQCVDCYEWYHLSVSVYLLEQTSKTLIGSASGVWTWLTVRAFRGGGQGEKFPRNATTGTVQGRMALNWVEASPCGTVRLPLGMAKWQR